MKTAEEWHHTEKYVQAQKVTNPNWKCRCASCEHVRLIQADASEGLIDAFRQFPSFEPQTGQQRACHTYTMSGAKWGSWLNNVWRKAEQESK